MRLVTLVAVLLIAGFAARASAEPSPPWTITGHGAGAVTLPAGTRLPFGAVIASKAALKAYPDLTVTVGHPPCSTPCEWYDTFTWRDNAVIFVAARLRHEFEVSKMVRLHGVLRVSVEPRYPGQPDASRPFTTWETVAVSRSLIGSPLPRRVVVTTR